jgi:hypothetical protein
MHIAAARALAGTPERPCLGTLLAAFASAPRAKKDRRLIKAGYGTKKGKFGFVLLGNAGKTRRGRKGRKGTRKQRGGSPSKIIM